MSEDAVIWPRVTHCPTCGESVVGIYPMECPDCLRIRPIRLLLNDIRELLKEAAKR